MLLILIFIRLSLLMRRPHMLRLLRLTIVRLLSLRPLRHLRLWFLRLLGLWFIKFSLDFSGLSISGFLILGLSGFLGYLMFRLLRLRLPWVSHALVCAKTNLKSVVMKLTLS